jgi:thiamine biosynthesis lipoprotein
LYLYKFEAFTTPCELHIQASVKTVADDAAQIIFSQTKRLEHYYGFFRETSELYAINNRINNTHTISDEFAGLIQMALFYTKMTQGVFDIALSGTLKASLKASTLENYHTLRDTLLPFASSEHILLEGNQLTFSNDFTKIDFGGLVKEYAVDQAVLQFQNLGIKSALVNFGGDIAAYGTCHDEPWKVGIQDPNSLNLNIMEVELHNHSLCTSGHSKRFHEIERIKISHIIPSDPVFQNDNQVSILAPTTVDAGAWSTALLINPNLILPDHIKPINIIY